MSNSCKGMHGTGTSYDWQRYETGGFLAFLMHLHNIIYYIRTQCTPCITLPRIPLGFYFSLLDLVSMSGGACSKLTVSCGSACLTLNDKVFSTTVPPLIMAFIVKPCLSCCVARGEVVQARLNEIYVLPPWNLSLRMAQTLTVVFVICMYSGGMVGHRDWFRVFLTWLFHLVPQHHTTTA